MFRGWKEKRRDLGQWNPTEKFIGHAHIKGRLVHHIWCFANNRGSTSLFAVKCGLLMGYSEIVLCGIPYDGSGRFFDPPGVGKDYEKANGWEDWPKLAASVFDGRVKSMSGRTRELLGEPQ